MTVKFVRANLGLLTTAALILVPIAVMSYIIWRNPAPATAIVTVVPGLSTPVSPDTPAWPPGQVLVKPGQAGTPTTTPTLYSPFCSALLTAVQAAVPLQGVQFTSPGGASRAVAVYGVTTGEIEQRAEGSLELDLARMLYLDKNGELRALWFATGYVDGSGTYYPMNIVDPRGKRAWATRQEAEAIFRQSGKGLRLILTGFLRGDKEIAWENCEQWAFANPPGICSLGLDLELASHGGSAQFIQTGLAPEDWFAFGWAIEFDGADADLPNNTGGCVP